MRAFRGSHYAIQALSELVYMHNSSRMPSVTRMCNLRAQQHWPTHHRVDGMVLGLGTARAPLADGRVEGLPRVALGRLKRVRRKVLAGGGNLRTARRKPRADQRAPRGAGSLKQNMHGRGAERTRQVLPCRRVASAWKNKCTFITALQDMKGADMRGMAIHCQASAPLPLCTSSRCLAGHARTRSPGGRSGRGPARARAPKLAPVTTHVKAGRGSRGRPDNAYVTVACS